MSDRQGAGSARSHDSEDRERLSPEELNALVTGTEPEDDPETAGCIMTCASGASASEHD